MASEIVNQWLQKAKDDYVSATVLMEKVQPPQIEIACYHSQQCAEKALKAFCSFKGSEIQKTHNLIVLCQSCTALNSEFSTLISDCAKLTPYSVQTRYPNNIEILESEAKSAIASAKKIYDFVEAKIAEHYHQEK